MRLNCRSVVARTSKLATTPGEWMRPRSKSEKPGFTSTRQSILREHLGVSLESDARRRGSQALLLQSATGYSLFSTSWVFCREARTPAHSPGRPTCDQRGQERNLPQSDHRSESRWTSSRNGRTEASEIPQQPDRARSSLHQTADEAWDGLFLLRDRVANPPRLRDDEHATERASARSGKRGHQRASRSGCHIVWTGCLRNIAKAAHAQFLFF